MGEVQAGDAVSCRLGTVAVEKQVVAGLGSTPGSGWPRRPPPTWQLVAAFPKLYKLAAAHHELPSRRTIASL